jgi:hypothetical protein
MILIGQEAPPLSTWFQTNPQTREQLRVSLILVANWINDALLTDDAPRSAVDRLADIRQYYTNASVGRTALEDKSDERIFQLLFCAFAHVQEIQPHMRHGYTYTWQPESPS